MYDAYYIVSYYLNYFLLLLADSTCDAFKHIREKTHY